MHAIDLRQFQPSPDDFVDMPTLPHMERWGFNVGRGLADVLFLSSQGQSRSFREQLQDKIVADLLKTIEPFCAAGATDAMIVAYVEAVRAGMSSRMEEIAAAPAIAKPLAKAAEIANTLSADGPLH